MARSHLRRSRTHEQGSALFVAVLMLALMGFLGIAALDTVSRDRQVAGFQNRARTAFYAAEAGVAEARSEVHQDPTNFPWTELAPRNLGDFGVYDRETSLPIYYGDPAFVPPVAELTDVPGKPAEGFDLSGDTTMMEQFWQINVIGQSPDGSRVRLEVIEKKGGGGSPLHTNAY